MLQRDLIDGAGIYVTRLRMGKDHISYFINWEVAIWAELVFGEALFKDKMGRCRCDMRRV